MVNKFARKTLALRHFFVRILAPSVYKFLSRPMIDFIRENLGSNLVGVEIGVLFGENAKNMLKKLSIKKLYLIDPYVPFSPEPEYLKHLNIEDVYLEAKKNLRRFKEKVVFIKKKSPDAVKDIPDNLDFVYIDGNHEYESVKKDIEMYYPKVRKGG